MENVAASPDNDHQHHLYLKTGGRVTDRNHCAQIISSTEMSCWSVDLNGFQGGSTRAWFYATVLQLRFTQVPTSAFGGELKVRCTIRGQNSLENE